MAGWAAMTETSYEHLTLLGQHSIQPNNPDAAKLEREANPAPGKAYVIRLTCPEFTSLCPLTGQPDFAYIMIDYIPKNWIVESKSFKLLMASYRNHGAFHEACTMEIAGKLVGFLDPAWLRIGAYWYPRGGIPIDVFWQTGVAPPEVWLPAQDVPTYRGRG
jgi:7-cyano-7-deazaguanine reductase